MTWDAPPKPYYSDEVAAELKIKFGHALCRHKNPYDAAREIEPTGHPGRASWIETHWLDDPEVIAIAEKHGAEKGPLAKLPTKEELALKLYTEVDSINDKSTKLSYLKEVAELLGYKQKELGTQVNIQNNINNAPKVMRVPVFATKEDFEAKARLVEKRLADMQ